MVKFTQEEENIMHRMQLAIDRSSSMNDTLLQHIMHSILPMEMKSSPDISYLKIEGRIMSWWRYIGQWEFPEWSIGQKRLQEIADNLFNAVKDEQYCSDQYEFKPLNQLEIKDFQNPKNFAYEIRPKTGKHSLWPNIYPLSARDEDGPHSLGDLLESLNLKEEDALIALGEQIYNRSAEEEE